MTLEQDKLQNNKKNNPKSENSFSKDVFDILKEYKDKPVEKKYFSLKKTSNIQKTNVNLDIESYLNGEEDFSINHSFVNKIRESINDSDLLLIAQAKGMVKEYMESLGIKGDIISILKKLKIYMRDILDSDSTYNGFSIHLNQAVFSNLKNYERLHFLIHEILHHISKVLIKYIYDVNFMKNGGDKTYIKNLRTFLKSGYSNALTTGLNYGEFLNEGFTDLITIKILRDNGLPFLSSSTYTYNIQIIDKMILYVSEETGVDYRTLVDLLIKGYFHGDYKPLNLFEDILGKDFGKIIMRQQDMYNEKKNDSLLEKKMFFQKYPFMKIEDIGNLETLSDNLKIFLGIKKISFPANFN